MGEESLFFEQYRANGWLYTQCVCACEEYVIIDCWCSSLTMFNGCVGSGTVRACVVEWRDRNLAIYILTDVSASFPCEGGKGEHELHVHHLFLLLWVMYGPIGWY